MSPWDIGISNLQAAIPPGTPVRPVTMAQKIEATDRQRTAALVRYLRMHKGPVQLIDCIRDCELGAEQIRKIARRSKRVEIKTVKRVTTLEFIG